MINRNRNLLTEYIYSLYDKGLMRDYSAEHILIRAMSQEGDIFNDYRHLLDQRFVNENINKPTSFLINLSHKLKRCADVFTDGHIETFVRDQLSAGKHNYSDAAFFEALSEINVLFYLCNFSDKIKNAVYEPRQISGGTNPEARFVFEDDTVLNIEVKKGNFTNSVNRANGANGAIKPNIALNDRVKQKLITFCNNHQLQLVYPRISKIGDFIASAGRKFHFSQNPHYFNVLFINWTYTDFPEFGVNEPLSLLINTENGLFYNDVALPFIKNRYGNKIISESDIEKISAVVVYRDTLETLLSGDFRFHFRNHTFKYIINWRNQNLDFSRLNSILGMNPCNDSDMVSWYPFDYSMTIQNYDTLLQEAQNILLNESILLHDFNERYK